MNTSAYARFLAVFLLVCLFAAGCAKGTDATNRTTTGDLANDTNALGDDFSGDNTFNPTDSIGAVADAFRRIPAENAAQQSALDNTMNFFDDFETLYNSLLSVDTESEAAQWAQRLRAADAEIARLAAALEAAGLQQVAAILREILSKHDVYRAYNRNTGQHHLFTDLAEGIKIVATRKWKFEGVTLRMYDNAATGRAAIYRCYIPKKGTHYTSKIAGCDGNTSEGILGYVMTAQSANAALPLVRLDKPKGKADSITSMDPNEIQRLRGRKAVWKEVGVMGYMNW